MISIRVLCGIRTLNNKCIHSIKMILVVHYFMCIFNVSVYFLYSLLIINNDLFPHTCYGLRLANIYNVTYD